METKWFVIMIIAAACAMFAGIGFESYAKSECRKSFAQSNRTADDIVKICGK